ncbi:fumarylacetoacetase [Spirosoma soli]|uniref:fumarylacetoacetase n=1 Tax=Spirosoma soli TaxID=1770529 RepID=A0ABW5M1J1_9BACT
MYGIFNYDIASPRMGVKVGEYILDLELVSLLGYFGDLNIDPAVFAQPVLNDFIALGKPVWQAVNQHIKALLSDEQAALADIHDQVFIHQSRATMHLPVRIGDYTDFYAGIHHAENVGRMFRPDAEPLLPNYRHLPVAYHGRASSIVVSETPVRRPQGQFMQNGQVTFGPSQALDFELELGLIIGKSNPLGKPIPIDEAEDYIFGITLFNDWSARDIQRWEYQPLGPFLGKNFSSSMSAWVVPLDELEPFRVEGPVQEPAPLPYLQSSKPGHFDIQLEAILQTKQGTEHRICQTNAKHLYWSFAQLIAHHTVGGCNLKIGDVLATGTISGTAPDSFGSLLELSWNGTQPLALADGSRRTFLEDGDSITLRGLAVDDEFGLRVELGDVSGKVLSALQRFS